MDTGPCLSAVCAVPRPQALPDPSMPVGPRARSASCPAPLSCHPHQPEPCHTVQPKPPPGACPLPPGSSSSGGTPARNSPLPAICKAFRSVYGSSLKRIGMDGLTEQKTPQASRAQSPRARLLRAALGGVLPCQATRLAGSSVNTSVPSRQLPHEAEQGGHVAGAVTPTSASPRAPPALSTQQPAEGLLCAPVPSSQENPLLWGLERRSGHSQNCPKIWPITFSQCSQRGSHAL